MRSFIGAALASLVLGGVLTTGAARQAAALDKVVIASVPGIAAAGTYIADSKGYFKDEGIDVTIADLASAADAMASLATNQFNVVEGGYSAGYWNALAKDFPIITAFERGMRPTNHMIFVPTQMADKIKTLKDLKGHSLAVNAPGSLTVYEAGKMLESAGLTIKDVDVKYMPFPQMLVAFKNGAVDAAEDIPPFENIGIEQGLMKPIAAIDDTLKPYPIVSIAYQINTDWASKNKQVAQKFFLAIARGTRDYCQAYHHGPNRDEIEDIMIKYKVMSDRALLDRIPWQGRDPNGHLDAGTVLDIQDWFFKEGMITKKFPAERLIDDEYADYVQKTLPKFELINKNDPLPSCR
ncbi:MAG TPA: ABC transporter substrate-binding protein [Stellaceae bacterium]|nr:ABC transporter substrate-binding protein [Stellaceae bacterium]